MQRRRIPRAPRRYGLGACSSRSGSANRAAPILNCLRRRFWPRRSSRLLPVLRKRLHKILRKVTRQGRIFRAPICKVSGRAREACAGAMIHRPMVGRAPSCKTRATHGAGRAPGTSCARLPMSQRRRTSSESSTLGSPIFPIQFCGPLRGNIWAKSPNKNWRTFHICSCKPCAWRRACHMS